MSAERGNDDEQILPGAVWPGARVLTNRGRWSSGKPVCRHSRWRDL